MCTINSKHQRDHTSKDKTFKGNAICIKKTSKISGVIALFYIMS